MRRIGYWLAGLSIGTIAVGSGAWAPPAEAAQPTEPTVDLSVDITPDGRADGRIVAEPGSMVVLTLTVHNAGPDQATGPTLFFRTARPPDSMPADCSPGDDYIVCPLDALPVGGTQARELTFELAADPAAGDGTTVWAWAHDLADGIQRSNDPDPVNNFDEVIITTPTTSDMSVSVTPVNSTVRLGDRLDLTVTVGNAGPLDALGHGVLIRFSRNLPFDPLPFPSCDKHPAETEFSCRFDLEPGEQVTGTMTIDLSELEAAAGSTISWQATVFHRVPFIELPEHLGDNQVSGSITLLPRAPATPSPSASAGPDPIGLPVTGTAVGPVVGVGVLSLALGVGLVLLTRARRRHDAPPRT